MNDSRSHSEYFEELCALAASSQISELELVELSDHMRDCVRCQSAYGDFVDLVHNKLPLADPELTGSFKLGRPSSKESSYRERFVTRARKEGLAVSSEVLRGTPESRSRSSWFPRLSVAQFAPLAMALLLVTAGILGYAWRQSNARYVAVAAQLAEINGQIRPQERSEPGPPEVPAPENRPVFRSLTPNTVPVQAVELLPNTNDAELVQIRQDYKDALASANAAEERLQKVSGELQTVRDRLTGSSDTVTQLQNSLKLIEATSNRAIEDLGSVNENLRRNASTAETKIADQSRQIQELNVKLTAQMVSLDRRNVLFADGRETRDQLLDLRSTDVLEFDGNGKERKATARIFFTDGKSKSLLFVASGLSGKADGKVFQVWGAHGSSGTSPRSLGKLEVDNLKTDLWALSVNDASKLAGVDLVFVTLEKAEGSEKPAPKHIMSAYLPQIPIKQ